MINSRQNVAPGTGTFLAKASSSSVETAPPLKDDAANIHAKWYHPSRKRRVTSRDMHFRDKLVTAYLNMINGTSDLPAKVTTHLWTDRANLHALYMPVVRSSGAEIEVPHSMLAKAPLKIHLDEELESLMTNLPDKEMRLLFQELYHHPGNENIGFRADLDRLLIGILHSERKGQINDKATEVNLYIDLDTLGTTHFESILHKMIDQIPDKALSAKLDKLHKHYARKDAGMRDLLDRLTFELLYSENAKDALTTQNISTHSVGHPPRGALDFLLDRLMSLPNDPIDIDSDFAKDLKSVLIRRRDYSTDLLKAKIELQFMHKSLRAGTMPAAPPPRSIDELASEAAALAEKPQKSWSAQASTRESSREPVAIPAHMLKRGHVLRGKENDFLGTIPGHQEPIEVAKEIRHVLRKGEFISNRQVGEQASFDRYKTRLASAVAFFDSLHGNANIEGDRNQTVGLEPARQVELDYFILANKLRLLRPALKEKIEALIKIVQDDGRTMQDRDRAKIKIAAIAHIFNSSQDLISQFVNRSSYFPHIAAGTKEMTKDFGRFSKSIFGIKSRMVFTENASWKGSKLATNTDIDVDRNSAGYKEQEKLIYKEIRGMIRADTTDDIK